MISLVALLALAATSGTGAPAGAETIVFRSGAGKLEPGSRDTTIHLLKGPGDSAFQSDFTAVSFSRARSESTAKVTILDPDWLPNLPSDPLARWINQSGTSSNGSSALYSRDFFLEGPLNSVKLQLRYMVDNSLGKTGTEGIYVNEMALSGTDNLPGVSTAFTQEHSFSADITQLVRTGTNTLYLYGRDVGFAAGIIFSAVISVNATDAGWCSPTTVGLDPRNTYLRTNLDVGSGIALRIPLASLGVVAGDTLRLARHGAFAYVPGGDQVGYTVDCVFSVDSMLSFTPTLQSRVPGALAAGVPYVTAPTTIGGLPTDIPEDFAVTDTLDVVVPAGAMYLFAAADDEYFGDNEDPDGDFGLSILRLCHGTIDVNPLPTPARPGLQLAVRPNPVGSRLRFSWATPSAGPVRFSVFDVSGRVVREWTRQAGDNSSGVEDIGLSAAGAAGRPPGVLFVRMAQGQQVMTEKVVVLSR